MSEPESLLYKKGDLYLDKPRLGCFFPGSFAQQVRRNTGQDKRNRNTTGLSPHLQLSKVHQRWNSTITHPKGKQVLQRVNRGYSFSRPRQVSIGNTCRCNFRVAAESKVDEE